MRTSVERRRTQASAGNRQAINRFAVVAAGMLVATTTALQGQTCTLSTGCNIPAGDTARLIQAIQEANGASQSNTITLQSGIYTLDVINNTEIRNILCVGQNGLPAIDFQTVRIVGAGREATTIERSASAPAFRIFSVRGARLILENLAIKNGFGNEVLTDTGTISPVGGGALCNDSGGHVSMENVELSGNRARQDGGAVTNIGELTIRSSLITGNSTSAFGGGVTSYAPWSLIGSQVTGNRAHGAGGVFTSITRPIPPTSLGVNIARSTIDGNIAFSSRPGGIWISAVDGTISVIDDSTISNNKALAAGGLSGGLLVSNSAHTVQITNTTFSGNASASGAALENYGYTNLRNVTFSGNQPAHISSGDHSVSMVNTLLDKGARGCIAYAPNAILSLGNNIGGADNTCPLVAGGDLVGLDPLLDPLPRNNGGETKTHALLPRSPAIDAGHNDFCRYYIPRDQRGVLRPQDGDGNGSAICDIGAFEYQWIVGDFNADGCVDQSDLRILTTIISGKGSALPIHDLNGDGRLNIADARKLVTLFSRAGGAPCN